MAGATSGAVSLHAFYFTLPLAQALQFEMVHYRRDLGRNCYAPTAGGSPDDAMAQFDAIQKGAPQ